MKRYQTSQEEFWAGSFGDKYINRNYNKKIVASNIKLFSSIIKSTKNIQTVLEFGPNIGLNLLAIQQIIPNSKTAAVEINKQAVKILKNIPNVQIFNQSILEFQNVTKYDFVFTKGFLIHMNPKTLSGIYDILYTSAKKYICVIEYYNPTPVSIIYRGHRNKLFKRDFAGEIMSKFPDLMMIDYGFVYHGDPNFPQDDLNWFLMQKGEK